MTNLEKAAILLLSLDEEVAFKIMEHLEESEVQKIAFLMMKAKSVPPRLIMRAAVDFLRLYNRPFAKTPSKKFIQKVLELISKNDENVKKIVEKTLALQDAKKKLSVANIIDSSLLVENFKYEHPQLFAFIISILSDRKAMEVLSELPDEQKVDILLRIAGMEKISPEAINIASDSLVDNMKLIEIAASEKVGGPERAAEILRAFGGELWKLFEMIRDKEPELAQKIEDILFPFESLLYANNRGIQNIIISVDRQTLLAALYGSDESLREKFLSNMPQAMRAAFEEDLSISEFSPTDVEKAKEEIVKKAKQLLKEGKLVINIESEEGSV
ncbi:FliG C-terminal domain-containing protein [Desulfurobacterium crinifex]